MGVSAGSAGRHLAGHQAGDVIGIVGVSGKDALAKLIRRLRVPERGVCWSTASTSLVTLSLRRCLEIVARPRS